MTTNVSLKSANENRPNLKINNDNSSTITTTINDLKTNSSFTLANRGDGTKILPCLQHILSYLSKPELTRTALVSRSWKEKSVQELWSNFSFTTEREFDRIFHVLSKRENDYGAMVKSIELIHSDQLPINSNHIFLITYLCPNLESISIIFHHTRVVAPPAPHVHIPNINYSNATTPVTSSPQKRLPLPLLRRQFLQQQQQLQQQPQHRPPQLPPQNHQQTQQQQQQSKEPHYTNPLPLAHFSYNCPKLKCIRLDSYTPKSDDSLHEMMSLMNSGQLENITLSNCSTLQSSTLCQLAMTNPQLKRIELSGNTPVSDSSLATIMDRCGDHLEYLYVSNAFQLTDESMRHIASKCKKIKQICIFNNTERISEDTLTAIITHCRTLETISISDSRCLGPQFFDSVVQRVNIEMASIYQHELTVRSGLQRLCLGGVKRDMIHSRYMKELIEKSASKKNIEEQQHEQFVPESTIIRGNTVWWQRQRILISPT